MKNRLLFCILFLSLHGVVLPGTSAENCLEDRLRMPATCEAALSPSFGHYMAGWKQVFERKQNLYFLGIVGGGFLAVRPFDDEISDKMDGSSSVMEDATNFMGKGMVLAGSSLLTYLGGRLTDNAYFANTGLYLMEALASTYALTLAGKYLVGRPRPKGDNTRSFPSGHTSGMFAMASVLDQRYGWKIGVPAYLLAGYTGVSRVRQHRHYPTDVLVGAALGIIIGRSVVPTRSEPFEVLPILHPSSWLLHFQVQF